MMEGLTDEEYFRFLKLQELCPQDDPVDLYQAAAPYLKSEKDFTAFLNRLTEQKIRYGTEDEEERKMKETLTFAFTQQVPPDPSFTQALKKNKKTISSEPRGDSVKREEKPISDMERELDEILGSEKAEIGNDSGGAAETRDSDSDESFHSVDSETVNESFSQEKSKNLYDRNGYTNNIGDEDRGNTVGTIKERTVTDFCNGNAEKYLESGNKHCIKKENKSIGEETRNSKTKIIASLNGFIEGEKEGGTGLRPDENSEKKRDVQLDAGPSESKDQISRLIDRVLSPAQNGLGNRSKADYEKQGAIPKTKIFSKTEPENSNTESSAKSVGVKQIEKVSMPVNGEVSGDGKNDSGKRDVPNQKEQIVKVTDRFSSKPPGAIPKRNNFLQSQGRPKGSQTRSVTFSDPVTVDDRRIEKTSTPAITGNPPDKEVSGDGDGKNKKEVQNDNLVKELVTQIAKDLGIPGYPFVYVVSESYSPAFRLPKGDYLISNTVPLKTLGPGFKILHHPNMAGKENEISGKTCPESKSARPYYFKRKPVKVLNFDRKGKTFSNAPLRSPKKEGEDGNDSADAHKSELQSAANDFISEKTDQVTKNLNSKDDLSTLNRDGLERPKSFQSRRRKPFGNFSKNAGNGKTRFQKSRSPLVKRDEDKIGEKEEDFNCDDDDLSKVPLSKIRTALENLDSDYIKKKLENCGNDMKLKKEVLQQEIKRSLRSNIETQLIREGYLKMLKELPQLDPQYLLKKWTEFAGDDSVINAFIQEEKVKIRLEEVRKQLIANLPLLDKENLESKAKDFLSDPEGLENFIAEENKKIIIEEQYQNMVTLLAWVEPALLRQKCEEFQGDATLVDNFIQEKLLEEERNNQIVNMHLILPDADPTFLQEKHEGFSGDADAFNDFLLQLLESKNYPKVKKDDPALRERTVLWKRFVDNFDAQDFLDKIPNPEEHYCRSKGDDKTDIGFVTKFLESRYPDMAVQDLDRIFREESSNLTNTCALLDFEMVPVEIVDVSFQNENIPESFLLEMVFILRKREILERLRQKKELRDSKLAEGRKQNTLLFCPCCYNDELLEDEVTACPEGDIVCVECVKGYIQTKLSDGDTRFPCIDDDCTSEFTLAILEKTLPSTLYGKVLRKKQLAEVTEAKVPGLESCPSCEFAYIPNRDDKIFKCQNPDCLRHTCRNCKEDEHVPLKCEEVERPKDTVVRTGIEEKMTEALVRTCPRCEKKFVKTEGCNRITCNCGATSCYLCRKPVDDYSHFNGEGGDKFYLCPLFSEDDVIHVSEVRRVGVLARDEALRENPDVNLVHDPIQSL